MGGLLMGGRAAPLAGALIICLTVWLAPVAAAAAQPEAASPSKSWLAAVFFLLVFAAIALANLAIFRSGKRGWRRGAGLSFGHGFGGFGGGFKGFGAEEGRAGKARGFLR